MASRFSVKQCLAAAALVAVAMSFGGCELAKVGGDYLNLRNSFLDPSQVGRFDKGNPFHTGNWQSPPTAIWPVLEKLSVVEEPVEHYTTATDPQPPDLVEETKEYVIGEGDSLDISVNELVTPGLPFQTRLQVNEAGNITLPNLNQVHVSGLTPTQAEKKIGDVAIEKRVLVAPGNGQPGPQVTVQVNASTSKVFSILGQVGAPGTYPIIKTNFRMLDALALARDISGGNQPGMDYMYVIRQAKGAGVIPLTAPTAPSTEPATNPLDTLDKLDKVPAPVIPAPVLPTTAPATGPAQSAAIDGPMYVGPLPVMTLTQVPAQTQPAGDLDAGLGLGGAAQATTMPAVPSTTTTPPPTPVVPTVVAPVAPATPAQPVMPAMPQVVPTPVVPDINQAVGTQPNRAFVGDKWVEVTPAAGNPQSMNSAQTVAAASGLNAPRVIRISINKLKEGDPQQNIVIRPGDVIVVPNVEFGEFYLMGHFARNGVYTINGRKVTLKQAVAAAGGLDQLAIPRRCDLIRRVGNTEVTVQVDLQRIFDGEMPDIYLKPYDTVNVGTDLIAPLLAVTRNGYRTAYGWSFLYDRNFFIQPIGRQQ